MRELPMDMIMLYAGAILVVAALTPVIHRMKRNRGKNPLFHGLFAIGVILCIVFVPEWIQHEIFSPGGVLVLGVIIPVYESVAAVCSVDSREATSWLQFWIACASFSFATEFMDDIRAALPSAGEHWYEFEFFFTARLMFPYTDGATLLYDVITAPHLAPKFQTVKVVMDGWIGLIMVGVNTVHLWCLWFAFMTLPEEGRRFLVVALGTFYPMAASSVAVLNAKEEHDPDVAFWLTYWTCFSLQFVAMDYLENFVGGIPGFYSVCALSTMYLFLPMFRGADAVFRNILVPLSGQHENLVLRDAYLVRLSLEKSIPESQHERVLGRVAELFEKRKKKLH